MKARGNIIMTVLMILTLLAFLILSGVIHLKQPVMEDFKSAAQKGFQSEKMVPADQVKLRKAYGINARDAEDFIYFAPKSTMDASEILVIKFKEEASAENAASVIKSRTTKLRDQFRNYKPEQADIIDASYLKVHGKYLIYVASDKVSDTKALIEEILK